MRNPNFDYLKGLLIILVVVGHLIHGHLEVNMARWLIYSFHMPLFVGVSGYLFASTYGRPTTIAQFFLKYKSRLIIPWLIAMLIYWLYINYGNLPDGEQGQPFYYNFIKPYYHLWFVSALLAWSFTTWLSKKIGLSLRNLLIISIIISVTWLIFMNYDFGVFTKSPMFKNVKDAVYFAYRPQHYMFFVGGLYLKQHPVKVSNKVGIPLIAICFAARVLFFYKMIQWLYLIDFILLNALLILFLISKAEQRPWFNSKALQWLGINSFAVYLWHQIPLLLVHQIIVNYIDECSLTLHYSMDALFISVCIGLIYLLSKNKYTSAYLMGMKKQ